MQTDAPIEAPKSGRRQKHLSLYPVSGKGWKQKAIIFMVAFGVIGGFFIYKNYALNQYGDIPTGADELVLNYELPEVYEVLENDFNQGSAPAMMLYGNGLMLCGNETSGKNPQISPLMSIKQRQLSPLEVTTLFEKVRALGFDSLLTRTLPDSPAPPFGVTPSLSLFTSEGERRLVLAFNEKPAQFTAITNYLDDECKKAKEEFYPDDVVLESIKITESAEAGLEALPDIPVPNRDGLGSTRLLGDEAIRVKSLISKGNKLYKTSDGKKIKVRLLPTIPEYKIPKLATAANSSSNVAHADNFRKVRFLYVVAADEAVPSNAQTQISELASSLPGYYETQVGKTFTVEGASVVKGSKTAAQYRACPYAGVDYAKCLVDGIFEDSLASYLHLQQEFRADNFSTIMMLSWTTSRCLGMGGPTDPLKVDNANLDTYGMGSFSAPSCPWAGTKELLGAHEGGHSFGLEHTQDQTIMSNAYTPPKGYVWPLKSSQAALLSNSSPWFNGPTAAAPAPAAVSSGSTFISITPARILETRPNLSTADNQYNNTGRLKGGIVRELPVAGRVGIPINALAAALNVTVVNPSGDGFVTVFPCGTGTPGTSNVNFRTGNVISNMVISKLGGGQVCLYSNVDTDLVVDVNGAFPSVSTAFYTNVTPSRLLETRPGNSTTDGQFNNIGRRAGGTVTAVQVSGRFGIPSNASAVSLNVTVIEPSATGYMVVYPCGIPPPTTSSVNYTGGGIISNAVISKLGSGQVCIYTNNDTDLVIDVNGAFNDVTSFKSVPPVRLLDTRPGYSTVDGVSAGIGARTGGSTYELTVAGRGGVPADAVSVALNVTVINPVGDGFLTVFPCGIGLPNTSNVNYKAGTILSNAVLSKLGSKKVCIYTNNSTDIVVDVSGAFTLLDTQQSATAVTPSVTSPTLISSCPTGYTGTYPNCVLSRCPTGYTGTYPNCVPPPCPTGYTGTYPNCVPPACPTGYTGTYPNCVPPATLAPSICRGLTVYSDANYLGASQSLTYTQYDYPLAIGNDAISSARVPAGCKLTLYQNGAYGGATQELTSNWAGSAGDPWNDKTSSVKVATNGIVSTTPLTCSSVGIRLYTEAGYTGTSQAFFKGNYDYAQLGTVGNDKVSSVYVSAGCKVILYQHGAFSGATKELTSGWYGSTTDPWNDITSGIKVVDRATTNYGSNNAYRMLGLRWSYTGYIPGGYCVEVVEPSDPVWMTYRDNFLCRTSGDLKWSYAGPIAGMYCTLVNEPAEPLNYYWYDNYICTNNSQGTRFSSAGPIAGMACTLMNEPGDPHSWNDNYICEPARVTASSVYTPYGYYVAANATDDGGVTNEWASYGQGAGAWVQIGWPGVVNVSKVSIRDRVNPLDNIQSFTLTFSDGSAVAYGIPLPNDGAPLEIQFPGKNIIWMRMTVNTSIGPNIGVADIKTFPYIGYTETTTSTTTTTTTTPPPTAN